MQDQITNDLSIFLKNDRPPTKVIKIFFAFKKLSPEMEGDSFVI